MGCTFTNREEKKKEEREERIIAEKNKIKDKRRLNQSRERKKKKMGLAKECRREVSVEERKRRELWGRDERKEPAHTKY